MPGRPRASEGSTIFSNMKSGVLIPALIILIIHASDAPGQVLYRSDALQVERINGRVWLHTSYLDMADHGKFPCNGLVYVDRGEALVFDTPVDSISSSELLQWLMDVKGLSVNAVVVNHFHNDCLGGLDVFHERGIPSYAGHRTIAMAHRDSVTVPEHGFDTELVLRVGKQSALTRYPGAGHTEDNMVSYLPNEKVLFGGCLVKSIGAGKGNLADADTTRWASTVREVRRLFSQAEVVVPGHGPYGGKELLEYTMRMFER